MLVGMVPEFLHGLRIPRYRTSQGRLPRQGDEEPLRAELFSVEQLERHAQGLAGWHELLAKRRPDRLLPRLRSNEQVLLATYEQISASATGNRRIAPASEWILDNFYLIDEQIRTARRHLPKGYSSALPQLANGPRIGSPRVYELALELIQHVDGRVDARSLSSFIAAYQSIQPLKLGELWAIPIMLRLALIENLRRVAARVGKSRAERNLADDWAERMLAVVEKNPSDLVEVLADLSRSNPPLTSPFVAEFVRRIQGRHPTFSFVISWLEQRLTDSATTITQLVAVDSQEQAASQVSIGNSITSLRFLGATDWREFTESMSIVERTLRGDPADVYASMDFATRDSYRHVVERLAILSKQEEADVARQVVELASDQIAARGHNSAIGYKAHVGYFLVDMGLPDLHRKLSISWLPLILWRRLVRAFPLAEYVGLIVLLTLVTAILPVCWAWTSTAGWGWMILLGLLTLIPASQAAVGVANWLTSVLVTPKPLPRMDFSHGVPSNYRTLVAVPTMLTSTQAIDELVDELEVRYLANRDPSIHFALLTDFTDAPQQHMPSDQKLLDHAKEAIETLRNRYREEGSDTFFLMHRPRLWNAGEGVWMGYERKRGKLADLNAILRGHGQDRFMTIIGDVSILRGADFVITLDSDTQLPRDVARELIATMAHPLNRPRFDARTGCVTGGYSILQPRVAISLPSTSQSWFARLFAGDPGIDPYTRAVSDVYQDLFSEGSFIGKGIYDIDAFERACQSRFPENSILSHDLLEGCYARSALVSDILLFEDFPSHYQADASRRHRWMRGDWQITSWLLPRVLDSSLKRCSNGISSLSRWKILDNLRRSMVVPSLVLALAISWFFAPDSLGGAMTGLLLVTAILPHLLAMVLKIFHRPTDMPWPAHWQSSGADVLRHLAQLVSYILFLPYEAYLSIDAIIRTSWRMLISHRHLLEWRTSRDAERASRTDLAAQYRTMWIQPLLALATGGLLTWLSPDRLLYVWPILIGWLAAPTIAWWLSRSIVVKPVRLTARQTLFLELLARRTWRYFEVFVSKENNWLPPDNYQEHPSEVVAPRTSPTNIGLSLLANISARDFGFISTATCLDRITRELAVVDGLKRYRGHLYNWYDIHTLQPLSPMYISSVDSGNLLGHLMVLRRAIEALPDKPIIQPRALAGLRDTVRCFISALGEMSDTHSPEMDRRTINDLRQRLTSIESILVRPPATLSAMVQLLQQVYRNTQELRTLTGGHENRQVRWWSDALERAADGYVSDLAHIATWASLIPLPDQQWQKGSPELVEQLAQLRNALKNLEAIPVLADVARLDQTVRPMIQRVLGLLDSQSFDTSGHKQWFTELDRCIHAASTNAAQRIALIQRLGEQCARQAQMDFRFLYDPSRKLLSIGYNVTDHRLDTSYYDLLASESRLGSFAAIAQGQLPQEHWFAMGRLLTRSGHESALLSWSGSMFEYLMPLLVMPSYPQTLLDQTYRAVTKRQIEYARGRGVPWGISESGYNATDAGLNYQYRAFGVPGLGLKRGLSDELVIAPYASALALMVLPREAVNNLQQLASHGILARYGMYEAVDYTSTRVPPGQPFAIVRSFMAHHQGMSLLSLAYFLLDQPMQQCFMSEPAFKATELLLQERVPKAAPVYPHHAELRLANRPSAEREGIMRVFRDPNQPVPQVHLLSNGRYHVCISSGGGGYSRWRDIAVTRWREDPTQDNYGLFCYFRDVESGKLWSNSYQPTLQQPRSYEAIFTQAKAEFRRRDDQIETHTQISISPEDDLELRRITIANRSSRTRTIEITSFGEVALAPPAAELAHPSFSNLFVQTELHAAQHAVLVTRRPRSKDEPQLWMLHMMLVQGAVVGSTSFETNREVFLGRQQTGKSPAAVADGGNLSNTCGAVLDPSVSIRRVVRLAPDEVATIDLVVAMTPSREATLALAEKYQDPRFGDRIFELAWTHSQVVLRHLDATEADAQLYGRLASAVVYAQAIRRARPNIIQRNQRGQSGLWGYGISGDVPIVLVRISDSKQMELVRKAIAAHAYWRIKGLVSDLVIWNEDSGVYRQELHDQIMSLVSSGTEANVIDKPGGIFVRRAEQISPEDRILMQTVARIVLDGSSGTLEEQLDQRGRTEPPVPPFTIMRQRSVVPTAVEVPHRDLLFFNGYGGFTQDGREYVILLGADDVTPAPWSNVIANADFGTLVTSAGSSYTWAVNSHEYRITPWHNDPVTESSGEAFYIRDEESGRFWSPTPLPTRGAMPYVCRHGFGYSVFEYTEDGITTELTLFVAVDAPVRIAYFKVRNNSGRQRRISITGYNDWCLGDLRNKTMMHIVTEMDSHSGTLLARNAYNSDFSHKIAFVDASELTRRVTGDRTEFIGRNGVMAAPAAMKRARLSGRLGAALDPCAAIQTPFELADGQEKEVVFVLGAADNQGAACDLAQRYKTVDGARAALDQVWAFWNKTLGTIHVETPDPAIDVLVNGWLSYQVLSCRVWGRTGFYQSGGAFGFRDQLQDVGALVYSNPEVYREHLLRAAHHQFEQGDVQHWWHPPIGRGVRTRFSDDYLWLPLMTSRYVLATGDTGVLDEQIPYLRGRQLNEGEESYYDMPQQSDQTGTLYDHCVRAIEYGLKFGSHGLPLMGCGDWNDGMNLVGIHGKGESVWLGFFLFEVLKQFSNLARQKGDQEFVDHCHQQAEQLRQNIESSAWDGDWYRRAWFDDGTPLGSHENPECQIDSIAQSWSVLSGAGAPGRSRQAMTNVQKRLVRDDAKLIQLFDPPFDHSNLEPGYIKGYLPGVRENGGQYTHAAVWAVMAFAALGDRQLAWKYFNYINPVRHGNSLKTIDTYRVEPYVVAADIYTVPGHVARGGWTWYTGSAGWVYRLILENLLGLTLQVNRLKFDPLLPDGWDGFKIHYRYRETFYHITVNAVDGSAKVARIVLDGVDQPDLTIPLTDDRRDHNAEVFLQN